MGNKRPRPEEIVTKLQQVEVLTGQAMPRLDAIRQIGLTEPTFYCLLSTMLRIICRALRRRSSAKGGMDQLKELKRLQKENERLRRALSDLTLDKLFLAEPQRETPEQARGRLSEPRPSPN